MGVGRFRTDLGFALMKLGIALSRQSMPEYVYWLLESAVENAEFTSENKIEVKEITSDELDKIVRKQMEVSSWFWDGKIYYTDIETWRKIIRDDLIDRISWTSERFDCDNFATLFSSFMALFYGLNGAGVAIGAVLDNNKSVTGYHAYNVLVAEENGKVKLFVYEPQNDEIQPASRETKMSWAYYRTDFIIWR